MKEIDKFFDINTVLMSVFLSLGTIRDEKKIELIYEIDATIPKELRGNAEVLSHLLTQMLTFVFQNSDKREIVLSLSAPKDFLYEESISFEIRETDLSKEKVVSFLETGLSKNLELLDGEIIYEDENPSDIHINIPFKLNELGKRRYYRLPDMVMLGKKVLLICGSQKVAQSIEKMFKYFLYDVDVGLDEYKKRGSDLTQYDILVIEDKLATEGLENLIAKVQKYRPLKYVLLHDSNYVEDKNVQIKSAHLIKPVMQESIFELIVSLFENEIKDRSIKSREKKTIANMGKYIDEAFKKGAENFTEKSKESKINQQNLKENNLHGIREEEKEIKALVLDTEVGEQNAKRVGIAYSKELKKFLDSFDRSDVYFRQVVNEKSTWQIKEFCIELEKQAKIIGAQSMLKFADHVSLLFIYDKLDTLPIYTGKYHIELTKLITEIKIHLSSLKR
ncbi:MAG: hypothetical protein E3J96_01300 [Sulfurovum sp.]|nr:MAG: hypothetical protein E3J96_01300 [Sulfurovum sp.]